MYLKSIEVQGFKSFANKLVFKFNKGITGIVGPNGSGKSNVGDAVRWVLGEQSAKQLRGSKMEDVIFSGTETRKPLGFAYVAITLDNSDHKLSVDYDEVTVARRVYRSGESEYMINGHSCRLKDVQELFFDTGIGKEGYSIIGQGQIEKILNGKPEERRELFDEAAGIVKFKKRKQAAQKNLEIERMNLSRVNDILSELEKQIGPLKRQEETAREYLKLKERLKSCEVNLYLSEYAAMKEILTELNQKTEIVSGDLARTNSEYEQIKAAYEQLETQLEDYDKAIETQRQSLNENLLDKEKVEGEIKVLNEQIASVITTSGHQKNRLSEISDQKAAKENELFAYTEEKQAITDKIESLGDAKTKADEALAQMNKNVQTLRQTIDEKNGDIIGFLNEASAVKGKIGRYDTMIEQINIRKSELNQRLIILKTEEATKADAIKGFEAELEEKMREIIAAQEDKERLTKEGSEVTEALNRLRREMDEHQQIFHQTNSRYGALKNISERYDGYGSSIKKVMERKKDTPGIIGVVADIIKVEKRFETAIETALGGSIQNIVTDNEQTAKTLITYLKQGRFGRATFLPLTSVLGRDGGVNPAVLKEEGVINTAGAIVDYDKRYEGIINHLLGRIIVAQNIDSALRIAKKYKYSLRIVTLDGELLNPGGALSGGAYKNSGNLLGRSRELEELQKRIESIKAEINECGRQLVRLQERKSEIKKAQEKYIVHMQELSLSENTIRMNLNQAKKAAMDNAAVHAELQKEDAELKRQLEEIAGNKNFLNVSLKELDTLKNDTQKLIEELSSRLNEAVENEKQFNEKNSGLALEVSGYHQKNQFILENIRRVRSEISRLTEDSDKLKQQLECLDTQKQAKENEISDCKKRLWTLSEASKTIKAAVDETVAKKEALAASHKSFFAKREELSDRISRLDKEMFRLNHQIEDTENKKTAKNNYMWEEYELTYQAALDFADEALKAADAAALKKSAAEYKTAIKQLGNINVNAIEEYKEVSERYGLLKTQHEDLVEAEGKLSGIIESLDTAMREQFSEKFKEIQKNFDKVFKELFGGGRGSLELMEDEDILYAGIRIIASPPGKKLQNMMQMSGGEKALTAIALLFAIQRLKPSPFCLLDEIEAALDDANVKRYAQYLNNLTKDTQFIIITHRRGTMNAADVLYGITMQEKGVSTLVSVNLIDSKLDD